MKKLTNKKGFTLMEMIIVVAIIVILAAISIPTLSANLDDARKATDDANLRAAKSTAITAYMVGTTKPSADDVYDIASGTFKDLASVKGYGESTAHKDEIIVFTIDSDGNPGAKWVTETDTTN